MVKTKQTDNHNPAAKLDLRRHFLQKYHSDEPARVLDCCMGSGLLWGELKAEFEVESYLGLDLKAKKGRLKIDSARYLQAGGWDHDVIDVDTYGSPWKHWFAILEQAQQSVTVFLTIGLIRVNGGGNMTTVAQEALGLGKLKVPKAIIGALHPHATRACIGAHEGMGWQVVEALEASNDGTAQYIGIRMERTSDG